jgi:hydroxypyruvate isomerase
MGENPREVLAGRMHLVEHIQIADLPGRNEPGTGGIDFPAVFQALREHGYRGLLAAEYRPRGETVAGLDWLRRHG